MLDSEGKFEIKVITHWRVFEILLTSTFICIKEFCIEKRLSNIFKITNLAKVTKTILKSSCRDLHVTSKSKILKQIIYF